MLSADAGRQPSLWLGLELGLGLGLEVEPKVKSPSRGCCCSHLGAARPSFCRSRGRISSNSQFLTTDGTELKKYLGLRLKKRVVTAGESTENNDVVQVGRKEGVSRVR